METSKSMEKIREKWEVGGLHGNWGSLFGHGAANLLYQDCICEGKILELACDSEKYQQGVPC